MGKVLDAFAKECHDILAKDSGPDGLEKVRQGLEKVLVNKEFLAEHLGSEADSPRKILYEDPDLGFCILAHVYKGASGSNPHDHGPSWAIYGQAKGVTEMTEYRCLDKPKDDEPGRVAKVKSYDLKPGMAVAYNIGQLHAPKREDETRLIRIEGRNLEKVKRDRYILA